LDRCDAKVFIAAQQIGLQWETMISEALIQLKDSVSLLLGAVMLALAFIAGFFVALARRGR